VSKRLDLSGKIFGRLTVISFFEAPKINGQHKAMWLCRCSCGKEKIIRATTLKSGHALSCGCFQQEERVRINTIHGQSHTRLYSIWESMKTRCSNKNHPLFHRYGGRGIKVCASWIKSFPAFQEWALKNGYTDDLEIDRIDNDGMYTPANCRWVTHKENCKNTSRSRPDAGKAL